MTTASIAADTAVADSTATQASQATQQTAANASALRFITCGSVDDGKSTLIGRLLVDTRAVLQDQLAGVTKSGETDLALLTDGLSAEREQGITIDVAYRYFATESRKFIIGDAPGHEQYTRNMVTAASSADAAVVLVDATKLDWKNPQLTLLPQTRRHSLLAHLLRVHSLVFAVNKLDAVEDPQQAFVHIRGALERFTAEAGIASAATVPVSALKGFNVVNAEPGWAGYDGPSLLQLLEQLPNTPTDTGLALAPLYDEPFMAAVPSTHALAQKDHVSTSDLKNETMLLLGSGHCFRDHVLQVCPEFARYASNAEGIRRTFEGSSLETIKHMVAAGMGVTLVPRLSVPADALETTARRRKTDEPHIRYLPILEDDGSPPPTRRVVLAWRRSFTRYEAIAALRNAVYACALPGVKRLS